MISKKNHQKETYGIYIDMSHFSSGFPFAKRSDNFNEIQRVIQLWNVKDTQDKFSEVNFITDLVKNLFTGFVIVEQTENKS